MDGPETETQFAARLKDADLAWWEHYYRRELEENQFPDANIAAGYARQLAALVTEQTRRQARH